jgi:hypothetical protein
MVELPLQCTLVPRVDYTTIRDTLIKQKEFIQARIRERSSSHIIRAGLPSFRRDSHQRHSIIRTYLDYVRK